MFASTDSRGLQFDAKTGSIFHTVGDNNAPDLEDWALENLYQTSYTGLDGTSEQSTWLDIEEFEADPEQDWSDRAYTCEGAEFEDDRYSQMAEEIEASEEEWKCVDQEMAEHDEIQKHFRSKAGVSTKRVTISRVWNWRRWRNDHTYKVVEVCDERFYDRRERKECSRELTLAETLQLHEDRGVVSERIKLEKYKDDNGDHGRRGWNDHRTHPRRLNRQTRWEDELIEELAA